MANLGKEPCHDDNDDEGDEDAVGFSARKMTYEVNSFAFTFTAINEGTPALYSKNDDVVLPLWEYLLNCSIEAKKRVFKIKVDVEGEASPTLSSSALAQCFAQMVGILHERIQHSPEQPTPEDLR